MENEERAKEDQRRGKAGPHFLKFLDPPLSTTIWLWSVTLPVIPTITAQSRLLTHKRRDLFSFFVPLSPELVAVFIHFTTWNLHTQNTLHCQQSSANNIHILRQFFTTISRVTSISAQSHTCKQCYISENQCTGLEMGQSQCMYIAEMGKSQIPISP